MFGDAFYRLDLVTKVTQEMEGRDKNWQPFIGVGFELLPAAVHSRVVRNRFLKKRNSFRQYKMKVGCLRSKLGLKDYTLFGTCFFHLYTCSKSIKTVQTLSGSFKSIAPMNKGRVMHNHGFYF